MFPLIKSQPARSGVSKRLPKQSLCDQCWGRSCLSLSSSAPAFDTRRTMTRPILLFAACLAAATVSARPQFKLTPRELQAFETVLGGSHPVSISSAIPVMAFTDQKPSKFVNLPQGKDNGLGIERSGGSPIPAEKIHFEESFGRSATNGPVLNAGPETINHGGLGGRSFDSVSTFDDDSFTLTSGSALDSLQKRTPQTFSELNFGFQPVQSSISSGGKSIFSSSPVFQSSFSPSPQITHGGTFRPSIFAGNFEETTFHDDGLPATFDSGLTHGLGISSGFGTSLANSGLGSKSPIDVKEVSVTGKNLGEDDNLYRHHLGTILLSPHGAGPATIAGGKLLASRPKVPNTIGKAFGHALDDRSGSDLVTRSLDSQKKVTSSNTVNPSRSNDEKVNIAAKNDSQAVVGASIAVESSQARLRGTVESVPVGIRPQSRSKLESSVSGFINQGRSAAAKAQQDQSQKSQQISKSPRAESSTSGIGSFFKTGSLQIPNIQLPLQTASSSPSGNLKSGSPEPKSVSDIALDTEKFETAEDKPALLTLHNFGPPQKTQTSGSSISSGTESQSSLSGSNRSDQLLKLLRERAIAQNVEETAQSQSLSSNSAKSSTTSQGTPKPLSQSPVLGKNNFLNQATKEPQTVTSKTTKPSFSIPGSVRNPAQPSEAQQKTQSSISLQNKQIADTLAKLTSQQGGQPIVIANSPNGASTPFSVAQIHQLLKSSQLSNIASNLQQQSSPSAGLAGSLIKSTSAGTTVVRATPPGQSNTAIPTSVVKSASSAGSLGSSGGLGGAGGLANVGSLGSVGGLAGLGGLGGLGALAGGSAAGGQPTIIVKTLELDAKDADPSSDAFKAALAKATKEARLELGVSSSEELGVGGANLASLFGKRRRKRQLFGSESSSNAQSFGNALSTGAGIFELDDDEVDNTAHEE